MVNNFLENWILINLWAAIKGYSLLEAPKFAIGRFLARLHCSRQSFIYHRIPIQALQFLTRVSYPWRWLPKPWQSTCLKLMALKLNFPYCSTLFGRLFWPGDGFPQKSPFQLALPVSVDNHSTGSARRCQRRQFTGSFNASSDKWIGLWNTHCCHCRERVHRHRLWNQCSGWPLCTENEKLYRPACEIKKNLTTFVHGSRQTLEYWNILNWTYQGQNLD